MYSKKFNKDSNIWKTCSKPNLIQRKITIDYHERKNLPSEYWSFKFLKFIFSKFLTCTMYHDNVYLPFTALISFFYFFYCLCPVSTVHVFVLEGCLSGHVKPINGNAERKISSYLTTINQQFNLGRNYYSPQSRFLSNFQIIALCSSVYVCLLTCNSECSPSDFCLT